MNERELALVSRGDAFTEYLPIGRSSPARCSDVSLDALIAAGFLDSREVGRLQRVLETVAKGGNLCEDEELLASWLHLFELLASVRESDIPDWRSP